MTNTLLTRIVLLAIFLHFQEKSEAETATQSICPIRPATDTRGPPGLPGRTGSKGDVGMGKKVDCLSKSKAVSQRGSNLFSWRCLVLAYPLYANNVVQEPFMQEYTLFGIKFC